MNAPKSVHEAQARGWACVPVRGNKHPFFPWKRYQGEVPRSEQLDEWAEEYRPEAWAVVTGSVSSLVVLDFDGEKGRSLLEQLGLNPHVRTPSGGFHWYGVHDGRAIRTRNGKAARELREQYPGLDVRADGGYAVFFGRVVTGEYKSLRSPGPDRLEILPASLREFLVGPARKPKAHERQPVNSTDDLLRKALERAEWDGRNNSGFRFACQMRDTNMSFSDARDNMLAFQARGHATNQKEVAEPYTESEAIASLEQAYGRAPCEPKLTRAELPLTDYGNAQRLTRGHGVDLRYSHAWGAWLTWDGRRWQRDATNEAMRRAKATVRAIYEEAANEPDVDTRKAVANHARKSEAEPRLRHMVELAKSEPGIPVTPEEFDSDPWLLTCLNGTVELRTGRIREHRRDDLITKLSPTEFESEATDEDWERVLSEACGGSPDLIAFLARALGYSITGDTSEEKLFFIHGPAASGKSTVIEAVKAALGDYAVTTDFETFLKRNQVGCPRNDLARLAGARLVTSLEVEHGKRLADGLVKQLTGGDTVTARFLHREFFEFRPQMKLWLAANHAPKVQADDEAMWRRIVRIPFDHVIPEQQRDPGLKLKLRNPGAARRAILGWLVKGCLAWQEEGLSVPPMVKQATAAYRDEMDPLQDFFGEYCILEPGATTPSASLWTAYQSWAKDAGERWPLNRKRFADALIAHELVDTKFRGQRAWRGIRLGDPQGRGDEGSKIEPHAVPVTPGRTHGTDRDATSTHSPSSIPAREENLETHVPFRPVSAAQLPDLAEWDKVMNPRLEEGSGTEECQADSNATPPNRAERPEAGLEADSGDFGPGEEKGGSSQ